MKDESPTQSGSAAARPYGTEAELLADCARWARLLFERRRLAQGGLQADGTPGGDPSPAAAAFAHAPSPLAPLAAQAAAVRAAVTERSRAPLADGRENPVPLLQRLFGLDDVALDMLLLLTVYQRDPSLRALCAGIEGYGGSPRVTVGLLADLVAPTAERRRAATSQLRPLEPLRAYQLVRLGTGAAADGPGLEGRLIEAHERIAEFLGGERGFDQRLAATARLEQPAAGLEDLPYADALKRTLPAAWRWSHDPAARTPRRVFLVGPDAGGKRALLAGLADSMSRPLLVVSILRLAVLYEDSEVALQEHLREAVLQEALAYLDAHDADAIPPVQRLRIEALLDAFPRPVVVGVSTREQPPLQLAGDALWLRVDLPDARGRAALWRHGLEAAGCAAPAEDVVLDVAQRFVLGYDAVRSAAAEAAAQALVAPGRGKVPRFEDMAGAAQQWQTHQLGRFAQRVETTAAWEDLIAPDETLAALWTLIERVRHAHTVYDRWGFRRRLGRATGVSALFYGPPGTGKTMSASVVARELARELFRIDLSKVTSKWIGESEKALGEVFAQATASDAILLFDEADSLFARRTGVKTSVDRYANLGVNFLLQKMEEFRGVSLLTTNRREDIDEGFVRRIGFHVEFPLPDAAQRLRLWQSMLPPECDLAADVDLEPLADTYEMGGGNIRNAVLRAAFAAAAEGGPVTMALLREAANEEYRSLGKVVRSPVGQGRSE